MTHHLKWFPILLLAFALPLTVCSSTFAQSAYTVIELGELPGLHTDMTPMSISRSGEVVGSAYSETEMRFNGFFWSDNQLISLGGAITGGSSAAYGINNHGEIVGFAQTDLTGYQAVRWGRDGTMEPLPVPNAVSAYDINHNGDITGILADGSSFLLDGDGSLTYIPEDPEGKTTALSINNRGWVVGQSNVGDGVDRAFMWYNSNLRFLPNPPGREDDGSSAADINNKTQAVGYVGSWNDAQALLWDRGGVELLGALPGGVRPVYASGINDSTQIVGSSDVGGTNRHAFLWDKERGMQDLNDLIDPSSGYVLTTAWDINNDGWIIAQGLNGSADRYSAFLLIPTVADASVDMDPQVLPLLRSTGGLQATIELRDGEDVGQIDPSTVAITRIDDTILGSPISPIGPVEIGDRNNDGVEEMTVRFSQRDFRRWIRLGTAQITVSFNSYAGTRFEDTDTILVTLWRR